MTYILLLSRPLKRILNVSDFLKEGVTLAKLDKIANEKSDNECAALMQKAKAELFTSFRKTKVQFPTTYAQPISGSY